MSGRVRIGPYAARVVALATLLLAIALALLIVTTVTENRYQVKALYNDVRGLIPGGDVTAGSIVVGSVETVELVSVDEHFDDRGRVVAMTRPGEQPIVPDAVEITRTDREVLRPEVTMSVDKDFPMYEGTRDPETGVLEGGAFANIRLASNLGAVNRVVELTQGDPNTPEVEEGTTLSGPERIDSPVDFDLAVETLSPEVRTDIKGFLRGLDRALENRGEDFDRGLRHSSDAINEVANLLAEVNRDGEALRTLVSQGERVVSALASSPGELGAAAERVGTLLATTGRRQVELAESVQLLGPALADARMLLGRTAAAVPNLQALLSDAGPLIDELGPFARLIPPAGRAAGPFLEQTRRLVLETPGQLRTQRPLFVQAAPVLEKSEQMLFDLIPVVNELRPYTPEIIGFFQNVADSAANYDANGHAIRTTATLANQLPGSAAGGGELGPNSCGPGLLELPFHRSPGTNECDPWPDFRDSALEVGD